MVATPIKVPNRAQIDRMTGGDAQLSRLIEDLFVFAGVPITAAEILVKLLTVDGAGSGLDADLLDGLDSTDFAAAVHTHPQSDVIDLVADLAGKQETLVSGTNIKTINGNSLLGAGDLVISGGGDMTLTWMGL